MKRLFAFFLALVLAFAPALVSAAPEISASSYILIEAQTGKILAAHNAHTQRPVASTTKILTALIILEQPGIHERFTVDSGAIRVEGTSMGLREGDEVSLYDLAGGMLTASGNDAANAAAVKIDGSLSAFADRMNARAAKIGMENSHFVTPSGLHDEAHYSTAYDMALLTREALKNRDFAKLCGQERVSLFFGAPPYTRTLENHNRLLKTLDGCIGVKTGFTKAAGRCLVSAAERNGITLICVTLHAPDDWNDHAKLYETGFSQVKRRAVMPQVGDIAIPKADGGTVFVESLAPLSTVLTEEEWAECTREVECMPFLYETQSGEYVGDAVYYRDGREVGRVPLVARTK